VSAPIALSIAGSDSGGGAGIQADLKTFSALGVYGASAITALTAQNTREVRAVHAAPPAFVRQQIDAVCDDLAVAAAKIGMLGDAATVLAVTDALADHCLAPVVLDPVMVAKSGDALLAAEAVDALLEKLLPRCALITPNLPEVGALLDCAAPIDEAGMRAAAEQLLQLGPGAVLIKGGHLPGDECLDYYLDADGERLWRSVRIDTRNTHGTGCTLSAAIAAQLALGKPMPRAVELAREYLQGAIAAADRLAVGGGHGPVHHFFRQWSDSVA
jgi:hydroxymethylpyrimidine/phosphomethylpyrimidine kinase